MEILLWKCLVRLGQAAGASGVHHTTILPLSPRRTGTGRGMYFYAKPPRTGGPAQLAQRPSAVAHAPSADAGRAGAAPAQDRFRPRAARRARGAAYYPKMQPGGGGLGAWRARPEPVSPDASCMQCGLEGRFGGLLGSEWPDRIRRPMVSRPINSRPIGVARM